MVKKKKSKNLTLPDYEKILVHLKGNKPFDQELIEKVRRKIDKLKNPPERTPREKAQFECTACGKKFKRAPIICPECEDDEHVVKLDKWA